MSNKTIHRIVIQSPFGSLELVETAGYLTYCNWSNQQPDESNGSPLLNNTKKQLTEYFNGYRMYFDLPLAPQGTPFQKKVWKALLTIPYGKTQSYQQIAEIIKQPLASRAVGTANGKNPICIIIPCHRVIRRSGELGGYLGGLDAKQALLNLESRMFNLPDPQLQE
jgi:methylated-DNA-[protein]-cysteine S-methyltransferase